MRALFFNDPHYSRHAPECRPDSYPQDVLAKFHQIARLADKLKAQVIGCTGDWFHRKGRVTFREANDLLAVLSGWRRRGLEVAGILGNHDIAGHSLDSLDTRAVGSMVHSRAIQLLDHDPLELKSQDGALYLTGTSYFHGCDRDDEARVRAYGAPGPPTPNQVHVHLAHGTLLQRGTFFEDYTVAGELIELLAEHDVLPDVIVCGHLHFPEGIKFYQRPGTDRKVAVCRVGSLTRVSVDDLDRTPAALLIAIKGGRFVLKEIPIRGIKTPCLPTDEPTQERRPDHGERITEFVRVLREEADEWALTDHSELLRKVAAELGHGDDVLAMAIEAVEKRQ